MVYLPQPAFCNIMSFLHREFDYERQQVIDELNEKCGVFGDEFECLELVPSLMLPTKCIWKNIQSKYRCYHNRMSLEMCACRYCRDGLWGEY